MAPTAPADVPTSIRDWEVDMRQWGGHADPFTTKLSNFGKFDSASKMKYTDWLLLKVIWPAKTSRDWPTLTYLFGDEATADDLQRRSYQALRAHPWWDAVLDPKFVNPLAFGHMAAWKHSLTETRNRHQPKRDPFSDDFYDGSDPSRLIVESPRRVTRSQATKPPARKVTPPESSIPSSSKVTPPSQMIPRKRTPPSDGSYEYKLPAQHHPDEAVINMSMVLLLQGVFMTAKLPNYEWSILHKQFWVSLIDPTGYESPQSLMSAKTDGCLQAARFGSLLEDGDTLAIIEVKPYKRLRSRSDTRAVRVQEGAEMAAWISTECTKGLLPPTERKTYRRIILAQDFDEVFITVAEFDDEYVRYIRGQDDEDDNPFPSPPKAGPAAPAPQSSSPPKRPKDPAQVAPASKTSGPIRSFLTRSKARAAAKAEEEQITEQMKALTVTGQSKKPSLHQNPSLPQGSSGIAEAASSATGGFLYMHEFGSYKLHNGEHVQRLAIMLLSLTTYLCESHLKQQSPRK